MTPAQLADLQSVNDSVNSIPYIAATGIDEPYDAWIDAPEAGWSFECRDYAIRKAKLLVERGWSAASIHNILCYDELGDFHSVCGVDDGAETQILDNRVPQVYPKSSPPYSYRWAWEQETGSTEFRAIS